MQRQVAVSFDYDGLHFEAGLRLDLLVAGQVIVEVKSVEKLAAVHWRQVLTYLRVMDLPAGLLINIGELTVKRGIHRVVKQLWTAQRWLRPTTREKRSP